MRMGGNGASKASVRVLTGIGTTVVLIAALCLSLMTGEVMAEGSPMRPKPRPAIESAGVETFGEADGEADGAVTEDTAPITPAPAANTDDMATGGAAATTQTTNVAAKDAPALAAPTTAKPPAPTEVKPKLPPRDPNRGPITDLPMPRYVSLKGKEGNARRGPGLTNRIDWVFVRAGMPLRITGEYEHWRRIEDAEGAGGWVHFALLSGVRSAQVVVDMAEFHDTPDDDSAISFKAEKDVIGWILECAPDWCRLSIDGEKGWVRKTAIWGVDPGEIVE